MSDPALGLTMLGLIVVVIMMGFPTAFTLMGLGMFFGFLAFYVPGQAWSENKVFFLMVERTYGAMTNETLLSIPLFVLMGYVMERGALVDKMFYSIQLAFRRVPASLAVATLIVCTFWGIASGLVGAVVVLMGVSLQPHAQGRLRRAPGSRRYHRRWHARDPDSALGDDHCLCRGGGTVRGEALRVGDVPRLFPLFSLPAVHPRVGDDQSQDRAEIAGSGTEGPGIGLGTPIREGVFAQHVRRLACLAVFAGKVVGHHERRPEDYLRHAVEEFHCIPVSADALRGDVVGCLVVCGHTPAGQQPAGGGGYAEAIDRGRAGSCNRASG